MVAPRELKKIDPQTLEIVWADGHVSVYSTTALREACPCAVCKDEWTGERKILPGTLPKAIQPVTIDSVGHYGLKIRWSDGHATGIYTYEDLRRLCPCAACRNNQ